MTRINRDIRDVNGWGGFGEYWEERLRKLDDQWLKQVPKDAGNLFQVPSSNQSESSKDGKFQGSSILGKWID